MEIGNWVRVINPARGTYLSMGIVTDIQGKNPQSIRVDLYGEGEYLFDPEDLELIRQTDG